MRIYRDLDHRNLCRDPVVTIGNFDGVHLGHQALLRRCREWAGAGGQVAVVSFEPLPRAWFDPASAPPRLTGPAGKLALLAAAGVDLVWLMRFNAALARMEAMDFARDLLRDGLGARRLVLGGDFRFGRSRAGDIGLLQQLGFEVDVVSPVLQDGERISSTRVRAGLAAGDLTSVAALLGRPYRITGRVVRGAGLGRQLGYPTANVRLPGGKSSLQGVFAVRARWPGGPWRDGVASLGRRPVVGGGELLLEVHLLDYSGDLYGRELETEFVVRLRDETDFASLDDLVAQIREDERQARISLAAH